MFQEALSVIERVGMCNQEHHVTVGWEAFSVCVADGSCLMERWSGLLDMHVG